MNFEDLFHRSIEYPELDYLERYCRLVGLDEQKKVLEKTIGFLIDQTSLLEWQRKFHPDAEALLDAVIRRPPLVILAGDVGTGKTELSETVGDAVARKFKIPIKLYPMSLSARGSGRVGEMTQLIDQAFSLVRDEASKLQSKDRTRGGIILQIDEADALAQSRENSQMHHEDRAGVNALLRGIDQLAESKLPAVVLMCTNRLDALDPAIRRRACSTFQFERPNEEQRLYILKECLSGTSLSQEDLQVLAKETGAKKGCEYGFTYSDLTQRLIPSIVMAAFPDKGIDAPLAISMARSIFATPPFTLKN